MVHNGDVNGALRLLTNNTSNGILQLFNKTLKLLEIKTVNAKALFQGPKKVIHSVPFYDFDEKLVLKATIKAKGACGPSGLDAYKSHIIYIKNIHISEVGLDSSLRTFTASRLISLNKNLGLCPVVVGKVLYHSWKGCNLCC